MADGVNLGSAQGSITLDISGLTRAISSAQKQLSSFESQTANIGTALDGIARTTAIMGGALAVGVGAAVKTFASFEQQMSGVGASLGGVGVAAGITEEQFTSLTETAKRIGQDTAFSASEAAAAMDVLAKAGINADDIVNGVADASVNLAAAIGADIPQSAEAIAATLSIFSLSATDAADATDTMTAAINASQTDLTGFVAGLRNLGPQMANLGIGFQDTAAAIAFFTKFGLKGADVGISLARAIDNLAKPTDEAAAVMKQLGIAAFDAQGNFVGFPPLMDQLQRALAGASDETKAYAIQTIFGAEAADVMNIAVREGGDGLREMTANLTPAGQAATQAAQRLDNLSGALEKMRGSIETAAIAFGSALAPAIERGAGLVEQLANAFSNLPAPVQQTAAAAVGAAAGFLLLTSAVAKTASFAIDSIASFSRLVTVIQQSQRAMSLLAFATSPLGIGIAAAAVAIGILIKRHQDAVEAARRHREAIRELQAAFESFAKFVADLKLQGLDEAATAAEGLARALEVDVNLLNQAADAAARGELGNFAKIIERFGGNVGELRARAKALTDALGPMQEAMQHSGIDTVALARDFTSLVNALFDGQIGVDEFTRRVADITTHLDRYAVASDDATKATNDQADALAGVSKEAQEAADAYADFIGQLDDFTKSTVRQLRGTQDLAEGIDGVQRGYQKAGESAEDAVLRMDRLGKLDLSDAEEEALHLANRLHDVDANIARVNEQIAKNQDDVSMWNDRISTVTDTLGGNTDQLDDWLGMLQRGEVTQEQFNDAVATGAATGAFEKLDALLASGAISQDQYNKAKEAGIHLLQRSAGGIQDENAELVNNLIALDEYVKQHDAADGAVNNLTEAQQGFIAALQSSQGLLFLQTLQVLLYLESLGEIPEEKVTKFVADSAAADPVIGALVDDLGLIPDEKTTKVSVTGDGTEQVKEIKQNVDDIPAQKDVAVNVQVTGDGTDIGGSQEAVSVPAVIEAPDDSAITGYQPPTVHVPSILDAPLDDLVAGFKPATIHIPSVIDAPGGAGSEGTAVKGPSTIHIPSVIDAPDTTAFDKGIADATASGTTFADTTFQTTLDASQNPFTDALNEAVAAGDTFEGDTFTTTLDADDLASGVIAAVQSAANALVGTYTVTVTADTSAALAALQDLADHLPKSPAKKGPLSEVPNFDYVMDAFVASIVGGTRRVDAALSGILGDSVRGARMSPFTLGGLSAVAVGAPSWWRTPATVVTNNYALSAEDLHRVLVQSGQGAAAAQWIVDGGRY